MRERFLQHTLAFIDAVACFQNYYIIHCKSLQTTPASKLHTYKLLQKKGLSSKVPISNLMYEQLSSWTYIKYILLQKCLHAPG